MPGGNALIGRELYPLLVDAGLDEVWVSPRVVYVNASHPDLVDGFTRKTFAAMIEGVRDAVAARLIELERFDAGVRDLHRTTEDDDGVFCYTFFKGFGVRTAAAERTGKGRGGVGWDHQIEPAR